MSAWERALARLFRPSAKLTQLDDADKKAEDALRALLEFPEDLLGTSGARHLGQVRESLCILRGAIAAIRANRAERPGQVQP